MDYLEIIKKMEQVPEPKTSQEWLAVWRELAEVSSGLTKDDPRLERVMRWLNVCDTAFTLGSWPGFCEAAEQVREIVRGRA
jgi:hypothetical protein